MIVRKKIPFGEPCLKKNTYSLVKKNLNSKWLGTGPITKKFENDFNKFKNSKFSLAVNSCTSAIFLSLMSLKLKKKDEIITSPLTFCSAINSIVHAGGKPVLADIDLKSLNIDPEQIEKKINKNTKAILIVHFAGLPCDMDKILKITKKYNLKLIEDCAHAVEAEYRNKKCGNFGYCGCYSFYVNKNITTCEGGMISTSNKYLADFVESNRLHGMSQDAWKRFFPTKVSKKIYFYDVKSAGYKFNLPDLNSSIGISQLQQIENFWLKRKKIFNIYHKRLSKHPIVLQEMNDYNFKHSYHLCVFYFDKRKTKKNRSELIKFFDQNKIGFGIHYRSINDMTFYKKEYNWSKKDAPNAHYVGDNIISLPLYPHLKMKHLKYICDKIDNFFEN
jgi:dTDP-4-amino-4,6-dideoxygalactose transaminase